MAYSEVLQRGLGESSRRNQAEVVSGRIKPRQLGFRLRLLKCTIRNSPPLSIIPSSAVRLNEWLWQDFVFEKMLPSTCKAKYIHRVGNSTGSTVAFSSLQLRCVNRAVQRKSLASDNKFPRAGGDLGVVLSHSMPHSSLDHLRVFSVRSIRPCVTVVAVEPTRFLSGRRRRV